MPTTRELLSRQRLPRRDAVGFDCEADDEQRVVHLPVIRRRGDTGDRAAALLRAPREALASLRLVGPAHDRRDRVRNEPVDPTLRPPRILPRAHLGLPFPELRACPDAQNTTLMP